MHRFLRFSKGGSLTALFGLAGTRIAMNAITVTDLDPPETRKKGSHWANDAGTKFANPWPSFRDVGVTDIATMLYQVQGQAPSAAELKATAKEKIKIVKPHFGADTALYPESTLKVTFLGHACFLLEFPSAEAGKRGVRILLDPVFSPRCSPSKWVGPMRFTSPPCTIQELPQDIDAVVISHNHYDHMDVASLGDLVTHGSRTPHLFLPLNTRQNLPNHLQQAYKVSELDWWNACLLEVEDIGSVRVTATPAQHFSGRGLFDRNASLWASWAMEGLHPVTKDPEMKVYFGGDTGYCAVEDGEHGLNPDLPHCPAFKEIGDKFQGFDLGIIPIGAYDPRRFMSPVHCAPIDAVRVFKDVQCKTAIGAHWGAWRLTSEPIDEPPKRLADARTLMSIPDDAFTVMDIGETRSYKR